MNGRRGLMMMMMLMMVRMMLDDEDEMKGGVDMTRAVNE